MVAVAQFVRQEVRPGKAADVATSLREGLSVVQEEPETTAWLAIHLESLCKRRRRVLLTPME